MSAAFERQIRPIYEALDNGSNKSAILACNKLLKKHPKNDLIKALKALALVRSQKVEESLVLCDEVLATRPIDESTLSAMMHVLRSLGRHTDMVTMYEDAFKQQPGNEELGSQTFMANVRIGNWKAAQQIATKLHKQFQNEQYLYWSIMSAVLQANDPTTPANFRSVLYKLAHRLISTTSALSYYNADRFYLHLVILRELALYDEAHELLETDVGKKICASNLACDDLRRDVWRLKGLYKEEGIRARQRIEEAKDRNWLEFTAVLNVTFGEENLDPDTSRTALEEKVSLARDFFVQVAEDDGRKDRSGLLALLELEKRARAHGVSKDPGELFMLLEKYYHRFGDKLACFEDLRPYIQLEESELSVWSSFLESQSTSSNTIDDLLRFVNAQKLLRHNLPESDVTAEKEAAGAVYYLRAYLDASKFGTDLPDTELHPANDLALLSGQAFVGAWKASDDATYLYHAAAVLEYALIQSKHSYQLRLLLIRIYRLLGAPSLALEHYRAMNIKQVQTDTLSHLILTRASTFSLSSMGDLTYSSECLESSQIYMNNSQETAEFTVRAFGTEKYTQIPEFIAFEERLDNSLQRDLTKVEHVRMRIVHEALVSDLIDMELIELKFIFDRFHHDNRDFDVIPNYQPRCGQSFDEQTALFGQRPGPGWLSIFLKIYIRAFQAASDLDDTVEDKLLIGDRPKPSLDPDTRLPLKERLAKRTQDELDELTADELAFLEFGTALADWLAPYHDYVRPPASAVLAEAAKQTELKTGHPLKGLDLPPKNGSTTNGHIKKEEDPPAASEPPEVVVQFFDILLTVETVRFKPASVVKMHKLGTMAQSFKDIRAKASASLNEISEVLVRLGEEGATVESRKAFVEACQPVWGPSLLDHDFVSTISKKVTDARKQILEGVGKGILRTHHRSKHAARYIPSFECDNVPVTPVMRVATHAFCHASRRDATLTIHTIPYTKANHRASPRLKMSQYGEYGGNPYYQNGGGGGGGGGGGYLTGGSPFGSTSGSPGGQFRRGAALHSLRPVTIKQLIDATQPHSDAEWMIEDAEIGQITIVAQVISIQSQTTNCVYWLDDGTGRMEARHWVDAQEEDQDRWAGVAEGKYVRVMGSVKTFGNKRYINAQHLRAASDPHELYFHLLEAMTVTTVMIKGPIPRPSEAGMAPRGAMANGQTSTSAYAAQSHVSASNSQYAHLPDTQRKIVEFLLSQPTSEDGIHVAAIARAIGGQARDISEALDRLMDEGHPEGNNDQFRGPVIVAIRLNLTAFIRV
ncbi:uncharacterized protein FIBRA_06789 [Fibroporia radiculosa]|uniref:Replication protein A C-terminal domain-containing protein n=1 Tax=Fibroporia radiculosa TaxID=599839 RepID=J4HZN4_9APHY|nr:uncharacterized protein FIBRA_06789 [Fibroporia radiculosa]CCM04607.1 predicted protein [Fibroporia radiculosa]